MALTLLRHTTPDVAPGTCYGRTDLALADSFESELAEILTRLQRPRHIVSSPLTRCRILAARIAAWAELELVIAEHWIEMDFGTWEGLKWSTIPRPDLDAWAADFHGFAGHGGETVAQLAQRVEDGMNDATDGALVVTHAGCIKAALALHGRGQGWESQTPFGGIVTI